jgi:glycosyltransferase involved in cell wall biosynthesis
MKTQGEINTRPFVSVVTPAFNESAVILENLNTIYRYLQSIEERYRWEMIVINDGSTDDTGVLAEDFAQGKRQVYILHHMHNFRLGQALRYAFSRCSGDYIVVLDLDLSYGVEHISKLLDKISKSHARIVIASPFMKGGKISNVPKFRKFLSIRANRFLCLMAPRDRFSDKITNITGMVRAYDAEFLKKLNLKATDYNINPEIIYKAKILRARIVEIPAHLDWGTIRAKRNRRSGLRVIRNILQSFMSGFIFRPFMFFIMPGILLFMFSLYPLYWVFFHTNRFYQSYANLGLKAGGRLSEAIGAAFRLSPHAFIVGGIVLMVAIQLISLGFLAFQNKRYFEELYHFNSTLFYTSQQKRKIETI